MGEFSVKEVMKFIPCGKTLIKNWRDKGYGHIVGNKVYFTEEEVKTMKQFKNRYTKPGLGMTLGDMERKYGIATSSCSRYRDKLHLGTRIDGVCYFNDEEVKLLLEEWKKPKRWTKTSSRPEGCYTLIEIAEQSGETRNSLLSKARRRGIGKTVSGVFYFTEEEKKQLLAPTVRKQRTIVIKPKVKKSEITKDTIERKIADGTSISVYEASILLDLPVKRIRYRIDQLEIQHTGKIWITPAELEKIKNFKFKIREKSSVKKVGCKKVKNFWKLSLWDDYLFAYRVVKCCLSKEDALSMRESFVALGYNCNASPHIRRIK